MFARLFAVASLAALAVAGPLVARDQCSSGTMNCCNSVQDADAVNQFFGLLGGVDVLAGVTGLVGFQCSPIAAVGLAGNGCTQQTVCCTDNKFNGLIAVGCNNVNA